MSRPFQNNLQATVCTPDIESLLHPAVTGIAALHRSASHDKSQTSRKRPSSLPIRRDGLVLSPAIRRSQCVLSCLI